MAKKNAKPEEKVDNGERGAMDVSKSVDLGAGEAPAEASKPAKAEKDSTVIGFKNGGSRVFSKSVHGKDWSDLADEFCVTNKATIATRDGKAV